MTKTRITITLDDEMQKWIARGSKEASRSQSEIIRICLKEFKKENEHRFSRSDKARSSSESVWKRQ